MPSANRKRAAPASEGESSGSKRSVEELVAKYPYEEPKEDEKSAEFSQLYLSKPIKTITLLICDSCLTLAGNFKRDVRCGELPVICFPLCRGCISTNRRISQNVFFGITTKNLAESLKETE